MILRLLFRLLNFHKTGIVFNLKINTQCKLIVKQLILIYLFHSSECDPPPESEFGSWKIEFSYFEGEFWTFTEVSYTCNPDYTALPGEVDRRSCGVENEDGVWDNYVAPVCAPG